MMRHVFCVLLAFALLCCCSCVFAVEGKEEQEPQVTQLNAECADDGNVARWQLPGKSLWYNCTDAAADFGKMICDVGAGNCAPEVVQRRVEGNAEDGVFEFKVTFITPSRMEGWWERNMEKPATVVSGTSKPLEAGTLGSPEHKAPGDTSTTNSESSPAVAETSQASDSAPSGELQGAVYSNSAAPESPPDPEPTESGEHSSHEPPVELQEENAAAPPTKLSQTGGDGGAAGGTEEDTANTRLHALPLLLLAVLAYGALG
ncbi:90 kDa surface protein, putative [Trypanosoma cruzi]|nr:90 kDa surface protein, putative [Trypanosoma cruzi]